VAVLAERADIVHGLLTKPRVAGRRGQQLVGCAGVEQAGVLAPADQRSVVMLAVACGMVVTALLRHLLT
jgi:hypothetical protein